MLHIVRSVLETEVPTTSSASEHAREKSLAGHVTSSRDSRDFSKVPDVEFEELVGSSPSQRNWRGILIALLVIIVVCALIVVAVILVTPKNEVEPLGELFTFEDFINRHYEPRMFAATWIKDTDVFVYLSKEGEIIEYNAAENSTSIIMDNSTFRTPKMEAFYVSQDLNYVLVAYDVEKTFRHSTKARYKIYNRREESSEKKLLKFPMTLDSGWDEKKLQYAGWSPRGCSLTFVYDNNLYFQKDPFTTATRVTTSGKLKFVFSGIADWMYEEEILRSSVAHWLSPDSTYIAYAVFNDTNVPLYKYPMYGDTTDIYGHVKEIAYPKAGDENPNVNPSVQLFVVNTKTLNVNKPLLPPRDFRNQDHYLLDATWKDERWVLVTWSNRIQNKTILSLCDVVAAECTDNLVETSNEGNGWTQVEKVRFINDGENYLTVLPELNGDSGYWRHIAMVSSKSTNPAGTKSFLTQGEWEVSSIVGYDKETEFIYYISTNRDPKTRHLFGYGPNTQGQSVQRCLTCDLGRDCQFVDALFSSTGKYYILSCQGPGIPTFTLRNTINDDVFTLEDNADIKERLSTKALASIEYIQIEADDGELLWMRVLLPPMLKKDHITQYPLLFYVYGGPGTQLVTHQYVSGWERFLSSNASVIYATVDNRGTKGRGDRFHHKTYRNLGTYEVTDQIAAVKYLLKQTYVDKERVAIWGWSFGAFVTSHILGDESRYFTCGIAVAPVTDWRYYDTAYTERYMGLAHSKDNYRGYDNANVCAKAANFKDKKFLLVHGTADDNVHFQHSAHLIQALTDAEVDFRIQLYTDKTHSLPGEKTTRHLYQTMTRFLQQECWDGGRPRDAKPVEKKQFGKS